MTPKTLILTVGLPRSGKTTWARGTGHPIVSPDSVRLALHGQRFAAQAEPFVWAIARLMAEALFLAGHGTVVVDATNVSVKRRDQWREWFPNADLVLHVIPTGPDVCLTRAAQAGDDAIMPVINRMAREWDLQKPWEDA